MAGFIRRFPTFPPLSTITSIESVDIIDLIPPGFFFGVGTGVLALVGEWPGGPVNTPTRVDGLQVIDNTFGGFSLSMTNPFSHTAGAFTNPFSNGCAFTWLKGKRFREIILSRVDVRLVEGVHIQVTGTPTPLANDLVIPAGTRVRDASSTNVEFALAFDVTIAAGTDLTVAAFTTFDETQTAAYTTRTVADVPVYSTRNTPELAVGDVDLVDPSDLFRAGIGTGTPLPSIVVTASTAALDAAPANAAALAVLPTATFDARYTNALNSLNPGSEVNDTIDLVASARESASIRTALAAHVANASLVGRGRVALTRPPIGTTLTSAIAAGDPGVGANRSDRNIYCYPHFEQQIPELAELDPTEAISGQNILLGGDSAAATVLSQLPPENNPGQSTQGVISGGLLTFIRKLEDGLLTAGQPTRFTLSNYQTFKANGIMALRRDSGLSEWIFQSGITSVSPTAFPALVNVKRRRMADFLQDSMARIAKRFSKLPRTEDREDALLGELDVFLAGLLSVNNPAAQRIEGYSLDAQSGNTSELAAAGIFVVITDVRLLGTLDNIVLQTNIGEGVEIVEQPLGV